MADNKDIIYDAKSVEMAKNAIRDPKALEKYRDKQEKAKKAKGQLISELLSGVFNFLKNQCKHWWISALEFRKGLNQTITGPFSC